MTPTKSLAVKAGGLTKEQIVAHSRAVAETFALTFAQSSATGRKNYQKAFAPNRPAIEDRSGTRGF